MTDIERIMTIFGQCYNLLNNKIYNILIVLLDIGFFCDVFTNIHATLLVFIVIILIIVTVQKKKNGLKSGYVRLW